MELCVLLPTQPFHWSTFSSSSSAAFLSLAHKGDRQIYLQTLITPLWTAKGTKFKSRIEHFAPSVLCLDGWNGWKKLLSRWIEGRHAPSFFPYREIINGYFQRQPTKLADMSRNVAWLGSLFICSGGGIFPLQQLPCASCLGCDRKTLPLWPAHGCSRCLMRQNS